MLPADNQIALSRIVIVMEKVAALQLELKLDALQAILGDQAQRFAVGILSLDSQHLETKRLRDRAEEEDHAKFVGRGTDHGEGTDQRTVHRLIAANPGDGQRALFAHAGLILRPAIDERDHVAPLAGQAVFDGIALHRLRHVGPDAEAFAERHFAVEAVALIFVEPGDFLLHADDACPIEDQVFGGCPHAAAALLQFAVLQGSSVIAKEADDIVPPDVGEVLQFTEAGDNPELFGD